MAVLNRATVAPALVRRDTAPPAGIVHLGLGNFHRGHQAVYTDRALAAEPGPWGIVGVASGSAAVAGAMTAQDQLYTVVEVSPDGLGFSVPSVHTESFVAADNGGRLVSVIADVTTRVVSLTVTENGYTYRSDTGTLDTDDPRVRADLRYDAPPLTTIGRLGHGLLARARGGGAPVTVMSCDNLAANGDHTRRLVEEFAALLPAAEKADLEAYLANVAFPNSMVDRIVPATTDAYRRAVADRLGYTDAVPVPVEPFSMWVLEDDFPAGRPAWERAGVTFSKEVHGYEQLKMRLLNGTHSLIAYLGALDGRATIPDSVGQDFVAEAARAVLRSEYLPSVAVPTGVDVAAYEAELFVRWRNSALGHRTGQVGTDGSVKLRQRVPEPARRLLDQGRVPHLLALTVAGYLSCVAPLDGFDPGPHAAAVRDPARDKLSALGAVDGPDLARRVLADERLLGDELAARPVFTERVGELVDVIHRHGVRAATREALAGGEQ